MIEPLRWFRATEIKPGAVYQTITQVAYVPGGLLFKVYDGGLKGSGSIALQFVPMSTKEANDFITDHTAGEG